MIIDLINFTHQPSEKRGSNHNQFSSRFFTKDIKRFLSAKKHALLHALIRAKNSFPRKILCFSPSPLAARENLITNRQSSMRWLTHACTDYYTGASEFFTMTQPGKLSVGRRRRKTPMHACEEWVVPNFPFVKRKKSGGTLIWTPGTSTSAANISVASLQQSHIGKTLQRAIAFNENFFFFTSYAWVEFIAKHAVD